jgi:CheY-like chemotaxis protein
MSGDLSAKSSFPSLRVLVVDDNESVTKTFGWMLEVLGYEARVARDGQTALAIARAFLPDVVMLDINLPSMNGYELCQQMRAEPDLAQCIFVAQTGWSQPEYLQRSKEAGFDHHWVKPIPMERLEKLLSSLSHKDAA